MLLDHLNSETDSNPHLNLHLEAGYVCREQVQMLLALGSQVSEALKGSQGLLEDCYHAVALVETDSCKILRVVV